MEMVKVRCFLVIFCAVYVGEDKYTSSYFKVTGFVSWKLKLVSAGSSI